MVLQNYRLAVTQRFSNSLSFFSVQDHASEVVINRVTLPESQRVLSHHIQFTAKDTEGLSINAVCVASCINVWTSFVDLRVDGECGCVDRFFTFHDLAIFIDQDEI